MDRLLIYLKLTGNAPLDQEVQEQISKRISKAYFATPGSVTAALRSGVETLNDILVERNRSLASNGQRGVGLLNLLVLRGNQCFLAQCGPLHAFWITGGEVTHWYDYTMEGRGLGQAKSVPVSFSQAVLQPSDALLFAVHLRSTWDNDVLSGLQGQGPEGVRRRLFTRLDSGLDTVLVQARPGKGQIQVNAPSRPIASGAESEQPLIPDNPPAAAPVSAAQAAQGVVPAALDASRQAAGTSTSVPPAAPAVQVSPGNSSHPAPSSPPPPRKPSPAAFSAQPPVQPAGARFWKRTGDILEPVSNTTGKLGSGIKNFFRQLLPDSSMTTIPSRYMALIAILVPLVVVITGTYVYLSRGQSTQFAALMEQANQSATRAEAGTDLYDQRQNWESVLNILDQVDTLRTSPESQELRQKAMTALDDMDLVRRLDYKPALVANLPDTAIISRIVISNQDLYMLDKSSGNVLRAVLDPKTGYQLDASFRCGPSVPGLVSPLVDIAAWPPGNQPNAAIIGLDPQGYLVFCGPSMEQDPQLLVLAGGMTPGQLQKFSLDISDLYVLDISGPQLWIYWKSNIESAPQAYFDPANTELQPPPMNDIADFSAADRLVYMLHQDGHLTTCSFSGLLEAPPQCNDPAPYIDFRPGREGQVLNPQTPFTQIMYSPPPDPSLYFLDPVRRAIYRFSLRTLAFKRQYVPLESLPGEQATALTVNSVDRTAFLAIGNMVYYANLP